MAILNAIKVVIDEREWSLFVAGPLVNEEVTKIATDAVKELLEKAQRGELQK